MRMKRLILFRIFLLPYGRRVFLDNVEQIKAYLFVSVKNSCLNYLNHQKVVSNLTL